MKKFKAKVGDIVSIEGYDLVNYRDGQEGDKAPFVMYGMLEEINKEQIKIIMAEILDGEATTAQNGFDERFSLPRGCVSKITVLRKGKKKKSIDKVVVSEVK